MKIKQFFKVSKNIYINLEKARITKYIRKWKVGDKWRYLYKEDFKNPFKALLDFFSFSKDKIKNSYNKIKVKEKYNIDEKIFASHLLEYLSNRKKWDLFFSSKKEKKLIIKDKKDIGKKSSNKVMNQQTKMSFNKDLMRDIYNIFNKKKEKEPIEKEKYKFSDNVIISIENDLKDKGGDIDKVITGLKTIKKMNQKTWEDSSYPDQLIYATILKKRKEKEIVEEKINNEIKKKEIEDIPNQFKNKPINKKTLEIVSKGKKYFKVKIPGNNFLMDLLITESNNNFKIGSVIEMNVIEDKQKNKFGTKIQFFPLSDNKFETLQSLNKENDEQKNDEEQKLLNEILELEEKEKGIMDEKEKQKTLEKMNKWLGYVKEAASKGYVYEKGVKQLQALGIEKIENLNNKLKDVLETANKNKEKNNENKKIRKINDYLGYMENAAKKGYVYQNGLATLQSLGIENYPDKQEKLNKILSAIEEKKKTETIDYAIFQENFSPSLDIPTKLGDKIVVYEKSGKPFYIQEEDEYLFGPYAGSGKAYRFYYREANEEEIKAYNKYQEKLKKEQEIKNNFIDLKNNFSSFIGQEGEYYKEDKEIKLSGKKFFDTTDIYGGGEYYLIDDKEEYLWHVRNNGMDGDNWSYNNIYTGGAGAIGRRIKYTEDIKKKFKDLLDAKELVDLIEK